MTGDGHPGLAASARVDLAGVAAQAIAGTDGVSATTGPAGRWQTVGPEHAIAGVVAVEDGAGRIELELHLVARWPLQTSLAELGEELRERLRGFAGAAGMRARLGPVSVAFEDVLTELEGVLTELESV